MFDVPKDTYALNSSSMDGTFLKLDHTVFLANLGAIQGVNT
jgi:hypothetical protein